MKNVLVVDDNPIVRRHLRGLLERDGCVVSEASDGEQALALVDERTFDAMFLDLHMPALDGAGVLTGLHARKKTLPVILITSSDSSAEIVRAFKLGARDYLLKPFREAQIRRALQQATGYDATTVQRSRTDVALVDADEDFAQQVRGLLADGDVLDHLEDRALAPAVLARRHQLVLVGSLGATAAAASDEAEALGDLAAQLDPPAALVRLLPDRAGALPEVTVFHAGVPRGDDAALKRVLKAVRSGGTMASGRVVRALGYDGPAELAHLYWWTLRNSLEASLGAALKGGSQATLDLSLVPGDEARLNELVDWALEFGAERMAEISVQRDPAKQAVAAPRQGTPPTPAPAAPVTSFPSPAPARAAGSPSTPAPGEGATRVQAPALREALQHSTRTGAAAPPPDATRVQPAALKASLQQSTRGGDRASRVEAPMGDIPSPFGDEAPPAAPPAHAAVPAPPRPSAPDIGAAATDLAIPGFQLGALIGEGGMSRVYRAVQKSLRRQVCVKVMREELAHDPSLAERFQDEGIALATLRHPNIVSVLDVGRSDEGQLFMVMEYVDGGDLRGLLGSGERVPLRQAVEVMLQLLSGLAEAHGHGIIHRDLKPSNVLLTTLKDGSRLVKLVDFGIAKILEGVRLGTGNTRVGTVVGTPGYMAPEQLLGMPVTFATDLYAVGIILFELVTGRRPFVARDEFELAQLTMMTPVPHLKEFGAEVPDELDLLLNGLLAKNPKDRPQSAADVRSRLAAIALPAA